MLANNTEKKTRKKANKLTVTECCAKQGDYKMTTRPQNSTATQCNDKNGDFPITSCFFLFDNQGESPDVLLSFHNLSDVSFYAKGTRALWASNLGVGHN